MTTETIVCSTCGESWERERKRGRKPKQCDDCKLGGVKTAAETQDVDTATDAPSGDTVYIDPNPQSKFDRSFVPYGERPIKYYNDVMYARMQVGKKVIEVGEHLNIKGEEDTYRFRGLFEREGMLAVELVGVNGPYSGKYRTVYPGRVVL